MKKILILSLFIVFGSFTSQSQSNLLNAKVPSEIGKKNENQKKVEHDKPLPYSYVEDRDILFSKMVWETIDVSERFNLALYFPTDSIGAGAERRSLFDNLLKGIKSGKITEVYGDDYFNVKRTLKDMEGTFTYTDTTSAGIEEYNNFAEDYKAGRKVLDPQYINKKELSSVDIVAYKVKGLYYFDKRQSELKYRIIGICPVAPEARDIGSENPDVIELFWVYYPAMREIMHHAQSFNDNNTSMPISFDQIFNSRRFHGTVYKMENAYGDRAVSDYYRDNAQAQLLESDRLKEQIRDFEQDMWNY